MKNKLLLALLLVSSAVSAKPTHKYEEASSSGVILYQDAPRLLMLDNTSGYTRWTNAHNGVILIVTTNKVDAIDEALGAPHSDNPEQSTRPGRIDVIKEFRVTELEVRRKIASRTLRDWPNLIDQAVSDGEGKTAGQFQDLCIQLAYSKMKD